MQRLILLGALCTATLFIASGTALAGPWCELAETNPLYIDECEIEQATEQKTREAQEQLEAKERAEAEQAAAERAAYEREAAENIAAEEAAAAKRKEQRLREARAARRQAQREAALRRKEAARHRREWQHKPTVTKAIAKEFARRLMRKSDFTVWWIDCDGGRINRTHWACKVSIFYRCLRGRIRVTGAGRKDGQMYYSAKAGPLRQC